MEMQNPVQSASRIFSILELLAEKESLTLGEIAAACDLHKATAHRLLLSLICMGYVKKLSTGGRYTLTLKLLELSAKLLRGNDMIARCRPHLEELSNAVQETVHLVRSEGGEIVYIDKVEYTENSVRLVSQVGSRRPMYCTGVGKAILSLLDDRAVEDIFAASQIVAITDKTITDLSVLKRKIAEARAWGYSLDEEENELGVRCIAAAIGRVEEEYYAFSVSGPISRMTYNRLEEIAKTVLETKARLELLSV